MDTAQFHELLSKLTGHLAARSLQQEKEIELLHQSLSRSSFPTDIQQLKGSEFKFEDADLFSLENIPSERSVVLQSIAAKIETESVEPEFRFFVREVPVRSTQLHGSMALWAGGASVDHTLVWPNDADFDPATLYNWYRGEGAELAKRAARWQSVNITKTANEEF